MYGGFFGVKVEFGFELVFDWYFDDLVEDWDFEMEFWFGVGFWFVVFVEV